MLKILSTKSAELRKGRVGFGGGSKAGRNRSEICGNRVDGTEVGNNEVRKKVPKTSKSKKTIGSSNFLIFGVKQAFTELRQAFFKAPILHHFDLKRHIRIETEVSGYTIGRFFSLLTLDNLG